MHTYEEQVRTVSYVSTASGALSLLGSAMIIYILMKSKKRLSTCYYRLVFGMSFTDILSSSIFTLCLVPRRSDLACTIQGMIFHLGVTTTPMYNASLCIYFVASIVFGKQEEWIKKRLEPFLHCVPIIWNTFASIFLMITGSINDVGPICWVGSKPLDCVEDPNIECERGIKAAQYRYIFVGYQTFINFSIITVSMITLCLKVTKREKRMSGRFPVGRLDDVIVSFESMNGNNINARQGNVTLKIYKKTPRNSASQQKVVKQAGVYVSAYFFPFFFPSVHYFYKSFAGRRSFALWITMSVFMPLQGFFNAIVFIRPRFISLREKNPEISFLKLFLVAIKISDLESLP